jgi:hypothetical protein
MRLSWVLAGFPETSRNWARLARRKNVERRITELQAELNTRAAVHLRHLQERLLGIIGADLTQYFEPDESGRLRLRGDLKELPHELRASISSMALDKEGRVINVQLEDRAQAMSALLRTLPGALAPNRQEVTGVDGEAISLKAVRPPMPPAEVAVALRDLLAQAEHEAGVVPGAQASLVDRARALTAAGAFPPPTVYEAMLVAKDGGDR